MSNRNKFHFKKSIITAAIALSAGFFYSCSESGARNQSLPILGEREAVEREVNGQLEVDTLYHQVPDFAFVNQDSQRVTQETVSGKIYVTDFFFTSCPSICPKMKSQMLRVYEEFKGNPDVLLLSHSIDPQHDTVAVLKDYADRLGVQSNTWHFLTGEKDSIYDIASKYLVAVQEDGDAAGGGFTHGGHFILVDEQRRIRGVYDGTEEASVDQLLQDIPVLLNEQQHAQN
ncbi:SCO family protein [Pontibacter diazotrophicus]|uniref:SCO family protein n=1 Tax=Pontibacter diazotrophicus TaxID=1400979 RepID=A0A3D8LC29_9BACT|nr:SCO family protein [Pontibacter diazotrophicus]RDV15001.1 SCO family protein [Pontibacter diazotrophicus]